MTLKVIGTGLGRTGTYSLKHALQELDLGPCYHMEEVILNMPTFLPKWQAVVAGKQDWADVFDGYRSAVDWPVASYYREMLAMYPDAKFVHTLRSTDSWIASFSTTIQMLMKGKDQAPPPMRPWLEMAEKVLGKVGVTASATPEELTKIFEAHTAAVKAAIPAKQLLVFEVKQGWAPLCEFLGVPVPNKDFPRTNNREDFWEKVKGAAG